MVLLACCLASHLQGEPHGFEPPFWQASFESTSPHHRRDRDGQSQASQTASWGRQGPPRTRRAQQRRTHDNACLRLEVLMRIPDVAWVPFFQSPSNILAWTLTCLSCAAVLDVYPRPPSLLDESSFARRQPAFCNHPRLSLFSPCQSLAQELATTISKTTDSERLRFRHAGFLERPPS